MEANSCLTDDGATGVEKSEVHTPAVSKATLTNKAKSLNSNSCDCCHEVPHHESSGFKRDPASASLETVLVNGYANYMQRHEKLAAHGAHCGCAHDKPVARMEPENGKIAHSCCEHEHHGDAHTNDEALCDSEDLLSQDSECDTQVEELTTSFSSVGVDELMDCKDGLMYTVYKSEEQMPSIMNLITKDLSEPYSIYTYRYFIHNWPKLCFVCMDESQCVGAIVCKLDLHKKVVHRGYIAMLAVDKDYRRRRIGSHLVKKAIRAMMADYCDEVVLETEITNRAALRLYENLGFVRDKRLFRYYLNGVDALRLKLWLK